MLKIIGATETHSIHMTALVKKALLENQGLALKNIRTSARGAYAEAVNPMDGLTYAIEIYAKEDTMGPDKRYATKPEDGWKAAEEQIEHWKENKYQPCDCAECQWCEDEMKKGNYRAVP